MSPRIRRALVPGDEEGLTRMAAGTGFFSAAEVALVHELAMDAVARGRDSHYRFVVAEAARGTCAFTASGPVPCTAASWDLYWIVVAPEHQRTGLGRLILDLTEADIRGAGGSRIYVETSGRPLYEATRNFYARCGYAPVTTLADFYAAGDDKVIYLKVV